MAVCGAGALPAPHAIKADAQTEEANTETPSLRGGFRPSPTDFSHLGPALREHRLRKTGGARLASVETPLPSKWDSRDSGWVTDVRNQGSYGTCWTFSTCAALETAFIKNSSVTNDFSENHLAAHDVGFEWGFDDGGNNQLAAALLLAWRDPLTESEDPYGNPESKVSVPPSYHVQDIVWLPKRTVTHTNDWDTVRAENEILQRAVQTYGAVSISYTHSWSGWNETTGAHYYQEGMSSAGGHAVTLVGWDDDYSTNNFVTAYRPPANGAFLVKNSWGPSRGDNGYAWISYYDDGLCHQASAAAYPQPESTNNYGRVYQYDPCGQIETWNVYLDASDEAKGGKTNWSANVFTSMATGIVEAVGFYAMTYDTAYEIRVSTGCESTPSSGQLRATQKGVVAEPGYVTIRLETPVPLAAAEKFAIAVSLETPGYPYPIPVECTYTGYCSATAHAGESFLSPDGDSWTDFQDFPYSTRTENICIKAYTRYGADGPTVLRDDIWVDAAADAATADGSEAHPFASIDAAFPFVVPNAVLHVAPGVYVGTVTVPDTRIEIWSTEGPEVTFLEPGDGTCCYNGEANTASLLAGFTLRNGACQTGGGAHCGTLSNCVITACLANYGGAAYGATLVDCILYGNTAYAYGGGVYQSSLQRCTVYGNCASSGGSGVDYGSVCSNSIVWANYNASGTLDNWEKYVGRRNTYTPRLEWCCTTPSGYAGGTGAVEADPLFANAAEGDFRLRAGSPCLGTGENGVNIGSWQGSGVQGFTLLAEAVGGGRVTPTSAFVERGGSATFTARDDHPFLNFETNGVPVGETDTPVRLGATTGTTGVPPVDDTRGTDTPVRSGDNLRGTDTPVRSKNLQSGASLSFTWTDVQADGVLRAVFTPTDFHVDAASGDDAANGWTEATAKRTLQAAVDVVSAGETIHVKPGTYDGIVIPQATTNLMIRSTDGATATFLDGRGATRCFDDYATTTLDGFTLVNGAAANDYGGGAYCGTLVHCIVSNCTAGAGGGTAGSILQNCLVLKNTATQSGGGAYECNLYNCTVVANTASLYGGGAYLSIGQAVNTIVATNVCTRGYANGNDVYGSAYWTMICSFSDQDVKFIDVEQGDYRLSLDSPCINAGSNAFVTVASDLDGRPRIAGRTVDPGAFERSLVQAGWTDPAVNPEDSVASESNKVSQALQAQGFSKGTADAVGTLFNYAVIGDWAARKGVSTAEMATASLPLLSVALDADALLDYRSEDVRISSLERDGYAWLLWFSLPDYSSSKVNPALLNAAVGVEGAESLIGTPALIPSVSMTDGSQITIHAVPPSACPQYFLKLRLK